MDRTIEFLFHPYDVTSVFVRTVILCYYTKYFNTAIPNWSSSISPNCRQTRKTITKRGTQQWNGIIHIKIQMTILAVITPHTIQPYTTLYSPIQPYTTLYQCAHAVSLPFLCLSASGWALNMKPFAISESHWNLYLKFQRESNAKEDYKPEKNGPV